MGWEWIDRSMLLERVWKVIVEMGAPVRAEVMVTWGLPLKWRPLEMEIWYSGVCLSESRIVDLRPVRPSW